MPIGDHRPPECWASRALLTMRIMRRAQGGSSARIRGTTRDKTIDPTDRAAEGKPGKLLEQTAGIAPSPQCPAYGPNNFGIPAASRGGRSDVCVLGDRRPRRRHRAGSARWPGAIEGRRRACVVGGQQVGRHRKKTATPLPAMEKEPAPPSSISLDWAPMRFTSALAGQAGGEQSLPWPCWGWSSTGVRVTHLGW